MDKINFESHKIRTVKILKRSDCNYKPINADFIRLEPNQENDLEVLKIIKKKWKNSLMGPVYDDLEEYATDLWNNYNIFAISLPQKYGKNRKLNSDNILGACLFVEHPGTKENYISILQTKPEYISHDRISDYRHIGQELVRSLQKKYGNKPIKVDSTPAAVDFYKKLGFIKSPLSGNPYGYIWYA